MAAGEDYALRWALGQSPEEQRREMFEAVRAHHLRYLVCELHRVEDRSEFHSGPLVKALERCIDRVRAATALDGLDAAMGEFTDWLKDKITEGSRC